MTAYRSSAAAAVAAAVAAVTVAKPSGASVGDRLVALAWMNNVTGLWAGGAPAGWSLKAETGANGIAVFEHTVDGTEGADFTFTRSVNTGGTAGVILVCLTGVSSLNTALGTSMASGTTNTLNGVAMKPGNYLLEIITSLGTTADTFTPPSTTTRRTTGGATSTGTAIPFAVGDGSVNATPTGSGSRAWTRGVAGSARGALISINQSSISAGFLAII